MTQKFESALNKRIKKQIHKDMVLRRIKERTNDDRLFDLLKVNELKGFKPKLKKVNLDDI